MCTLTYLPYRSGFAMVSSRDEMRTRGSMGHPVHDEAARALYPVDVRSGGTWILTAVAGFSLNLLNGGHVRHAPGGAYRHSRGHIPILFAKAGGIDPFLDVFDPEGLEPFTLVVIGHGIPTVTDLVWTGSDLERIEHAPGEPRIWSSSTLYDAEMKAERGIWFAEAIATRQELPALERLLDFHNNGGAGRASATNTIRMARPGGPETVCLTGISRSDQEWTMCYHDLVANTRRTVRMIG